MEQVAPNKFYSYFRQAMQKRESVIFAILFVSVIVMSIILPDTFFTQDNLFNVVKQISIVAIVAIGQTFVIITGGIDLSVGYSLGLCGIVMTWLMQRGFNSIGAMALGVLTCVAIGLFNGIIITQFNLPPFIATLGTANIARGLTYIITKGFPITLNDDFILFLGNGYWGAIPVMSIIMVVLTIITSYLLKRHTFGNRVLAIGGNQSAARLSGINVSKYKILVYAGTGLLCGVAGLIMAGRLNSGNPNAGLNIDMDTIAASIVGGTAMSGGEGSVLGTIFGALLLGVIRNSLVLLRTNMYWQTVVIGMIIIAVCSMDNIAQKSKSKHGT